MSEIKRIMDQLDRGFAGEAWHGPSLMQLLEGINPEDAAEHPIRGAHSIWELANHIAAWKTIVQHRAAGEAVKDVTAEQDWPPPFEVSEAAWTRALEDLRASHARLRGVIERLREEQLAHKAAGEEYSIYFMVHGLIQHDLYHAGQIAVLKKALR
jgi:uncharacterized damage-inducible protein DinB